MTDWRPATERENEMGAREGHMGWVKKAAGLRLGTALSTPVDPATEALIDAAVATLKEALVQLSQQLYREREVSRGLVYRPVVVDPARAGAGVVSEDARGFDAIVDKWWSTLFERPGRFLTAEPLKASLLAAGLLRTGVEREAVEACKALAALKLGPWLTSEIEACDAVGRAALAAERKPERWEHYQVGLVWNVRDTRGNGGWYASFTYEFDARAYAAQKNALEGGAR